MTDALTYLAHALRGFFASFTAQERQKICVVVVSEFGRTLDVNQLHGTDHGHAGA